MCSVWPDKKRALCPCSRGREIPVVPPQFGAPSRKAPSSGAGGAGYPVRFYGRTRRSLLKFRDPFGAPLLECVSARLSAALHQPAALCGSSCGLTSFPSSRLVNIISTILLRVMAVMSRIYRAGRAVRRLSRTADAEKIEAAR